ncbi:MAG: hypothetical protein IH944_13370 [Armatimonadetes bacterium]|nr:hypothetical protein [Armatimonadota bacterium]
MAQREREVRWSLPDGEVFVCACLNVIGAQLGFEDIEKEGLLISNDLPFELGSYWSRKLGEFVIEDIADASVKIVAHGQPKGPQTVRSTEMRHLNDRITYIRIALALLGSKTEDHIVVRGGYDEEREIRIHGASTQGKALYQYKEAKCIFADRQVLLEAIALAEIIAAVYSSPTKWMRFRRTLNSYCRACVEQNPYERMHMFVRTLDGVLKTRQGSGAADFERRAAVLTGTKYRKMLREAYDLRSSTAHLHALPPAFRIQKLANQQLLFLELLTTETLVRILKDKVLLSAFVSDDSIDVFWASTPSWSPKIQTHVVQQNREETWLRRIEEM